MLRCRKTSGDSWLAISVGACKSCGESWPGGLDSNQRPRRAGRKESRSGVRSVHGSRSSLARVSLAEKVGWEAWTRTSGGGKSWLGGLDSNQDNQIQSLMYYRLYDLPVARTSHPSRWRGPHLYFIHLRTFRQPLRKSLSGKLFSKPFGVVPKSE